MDAQPPSKICPTQQYPGWRRADEPASLASALAVADHFRLSPAAARGVLGEVVAAVQTWRAVAASHQISPPEVARIEPAFAAVGRGS